MCYFSLFELAARPAVLYTNQENKQPLNTFQCIDLETATAEATAADLNQI